MFTPFPDLLTGVGLTCVQTPYPGWEAVLKQEGKIVLRAFELARKFGDLLP